MEMNPVLNNRKSQPRSADFTAPALIHPIKPFENPIDMLLRNPRPIVGKTEIIEGRVLLITVDGNFHLFPRIGDRVVVQIAEDRIKQRIISVNRRISGEEDFRSNLPFLHFFGTFFFYLLNQMRNIHFRYFKHARRLVQPVQYGNIA